MDANGKVRILFVIGSLGCGGAERVAVDLAKSINHARFSIDFLIQEGADEFYRGEVLSAGCKVFYSPRFSLQSIIGYRRWMRNFIYNSDYDIVHFHQNTMIGSIYRTLRNKGIKIVSHAHSSSFRGSRLEKACKRLLVRGLVDKSDVCIGCSDKAAECFYGRDFSRHSNCIVIPNAVDVERFAFSVQTRDSIRAKYSINECDFVLGHVGSFTEPKNHTFLIDVFSMVLKNVDNAHLLLVGDGPHKQTVIRYAEARGCLDKITFTGSVRNPEAFYSAMDVFVFPSIFEGLPLSVVEAQMSGLNCIISATITSEVIVDAEAVTCLPIDDSSKWASIISKFVGNCRRSVDVAGYAASRWGLRSFTEKIEKIYLSLCD